MQFRYIVVVFTVLALLTLAGCSKSDTVGEVNGYQITTEEMDQRINLIKASYESSQGKPLDITKDKEVIARIEDQAFELLVLQRLIKEDAEKRGIKVSDREVDSSLKNFKEANNQRDQDGYSTFLKDRKLDESGLRGLIKDELLWQKVENEVTRGISVSQGDIEQYYEKNKTAFIEPGGIEIYHILVNTEKEAKDIIGKINNGGDFTQLAKQYSICPSKDKGGDLGILNENTDFVPEFKIPALKLQPGQMTLTPVKSQFGYHIIKAGDRKPEHQKTLAEVQDEIKARLEKEKKTAAINEYVDSLKSKATIKDLRKK
ncbi:MAG: SurA N-terminal domain-containing protein [Syntrophomonadaceae bacterium]